MTPSRRVAVAGSGARVLGPLALVFALALSCGGDPAAPTRPVVLVPTTVTVTPSSASLSALGETVQLTATVRDQNGNAMPGVVVSWSSSAPTAATVDAAGLVTAAGNGSATVAATAGSARGTAAVTVSVAEEASPDRAVLTALYEATDGPNWVNSENWLSDAPLRDWYGVDTDASGRVVALNLAGSTEDWPDIAPHGLKGPIPPALGSLGNLGHLDLAHNDLTGPIPAELGSLPSLTWLVLGGNQLTGAIPSELGNLASLTSLYLFGNDLTGPIPPALGSLGNLGHLDFAHNDLTGPIPAELGNLASLTWLGLGGNQLTGPIPSELGNLASLTSLYLFGNDLTGPIPPALGSLGNLGHLDLGWNDLTGPIPVELGNLDSLERLFLNRNIWLSGPLPLFLIELTGIEVFNAEDTGLCAPLDADFQAWLAGITEASVTNCGVRNPVLPGTVWLSPDVITPADPSSFDSAWYVGRDRRPMAEPTGEHVWHDSMYVFEADWGPHRAELWAHPSYPTVEAAMEEVQRYGLVIGRMPQDLLVLLGNVDIYPAARPGVALAGPCVGGIGVLPEGALRALEDGFLEEAIFHEFGHLLTSQCAGHETSEAWIAAQRADSVFISQYARDNPTSEDTAESLWGWFVVRCVPDRVPPWVVAAVTAGIPHRLAYFDAMALDMSPFNCKISGGEDE